jgi:hypothetical protein
MAFKRWPWTISNSGSSRSAPSLSRASAACPPRPSSRNASSAFSLWSATLDRPAFLYDALELELPTVDPALVQQQLESELDPHLRLRRAIVVPNSRVAYLARLAFGEGDYRVFYNDMCAALQWLDS